MKKKLILLVLLSSAVQTFAEPNRLKAAVDCFNSVKAYTREDSRSLNSGSVIIEVHESHKRDFYLFGETDVQLCVLPGKSANKSKATGEALSLGAHNLAQDFTDLSSVLVCESALSEQTMDILTNLLKKKIPSVHENFVAETHLALESNKATEKLALKLNPADPSQNGMRDVPDQKAWESSLDKCKDIPALQAASDLEKQKFSGESARTKAFGATVQ